MQFIYVALNNCDVQTVNKNKLAKWRHLDSLFCLTLIIGLAFFTVMQNGKMRQQIKQQLSQEVIEQIVNEKILMILEELNKMKAIIIDESNRIHTKEIELQALIKSLTKQLGLPMDQQKLKYKDIQQGQAQKPSFYRNNYEVFEIYQDPKVHEAYLFPEAKIGAQNEQKNESKYMDLNEQNSYAKCSYMQYWDYSQSSQEIKALPKIPKFHRFYAEKMAFANITGEDIGNIEQILKGLRVFAIWIGNALLVLTLCITLLMTISFILNRKDKAKNSLLKHLVKRMSQISKKRPAKIQKQLLYF